MPQSSAILCILDGWGIAPESPGNAIFLAHPQTYNHLVKEYPYSQLAASGPAVGLPPEQDGNSETGHLNIGAGRIVFQDLALINMSIADGSFFTNPALLDMSRHLHSFKSRLHIIGLIGKSGVHAYNEHLHALLLFAKKQNLQDVYIHLITDGRDSPPDNALDQVKQLREKIKEIGVGQIASIMGRYYAMDRDMRLERTQKAFQCLTNPHHLPIESPERYLQDCYSQSIFDEFLEPVAVGDQSHSTRIEPGDGLIFYNFRTDRARQLSEMFLGSKIPNFKFLTMTRYRKDFTNPVLFTSPIVKKTLGEVISDADYEQFRMAETEKIAMVSYYFNGQIESAFRGEKRLYVDSPKVSTYDHIPEMSTEKLVEQFATHFATQKYKLGVINIACPDMVAHTGQVDKTIMAIKAADAALTKLVEVANKTNSYLVITADHGNAEELINSQTGKTDTEHSTSMVPLIIYHPTDSHFKLQNGKLGDVAPTILSLLNLNKPQEMTGNNLVQR